MHLNFQMNYMVVVVDAYSENDFDIDQLIETSYNNL